MKKRAFIIASLILIGLIGIGLSIIAARPSAPANEPAFDGDRAFADIVYQVGLGPRNPGSPGHDQFIQWIVSELKKSGWQVEIQQTSLMGHPIQNIIAKKGTDKKPWIILGAHYDTRMRADQDPDPAKQSQPVPGADDGASGVAVLLELARNLESFSAKQVWLVFFDAEDQGGFPGWDWILGSRAFVDSLAAKPDASIVVDMVGDKNLNIYRELNSNSALTDQVWNTAARLGYQDEFINQGKYRMEDDHTPFLEKGLAAIDIIDFDYPSWHTTADTPDKLAPSSLKAVGATLLAWLQAP